jgi:hypothetical protein
LEGDVFSTPKPPPHEEEEEKEEEAIWSLIQGVKISSILKRYDHHDDA